MKKAIIEILIVVILASLISFFSYKIGYREAEKEGITALLDYQNEAEFAVKYYACKYDELINHQATIWLNGLMGRPMYAPIDRTAKEMYQITTGRSYPEVK